MAPESFEELLRGFQHRRPFRPFLVRFVSGAAVEVDHPEGMVVRGGVAIYLSPQGSPTFFDHASVSEVAEAAAPPTRQRRPPRP